MMNYVCFWWEFRWTWRAPLRFAVVRSVLSFLGNVLETFGIEPVHMWSPHSKSDDSKKSQNRLEAVLTLLGGDYCGMVLGNTLSPLYNARRSHLNNNDYQLSQRVTWGRVWYMYGIVHRKGIHLWRKQLYSCPLAGYLKVFVRHGFAFFTTVAMTYTVRIAYPSYKEVIKNMWTMLSHTFLFGIKKWWMICLCFCPQNGVYRCLTQIDWFQVWYKTKASETGHLGVH